MSRKRYMAIHTFHSDKSKEAFQAMNAADTKSEKEWAAAWTFEKCQCMATWVGDDDFFSVTGWQKATKMYITL